MTNGSCHRMWESNVHTWVNPYVSARFARSTTRDDGGVVCSTTPRSIGSCLAVLGEAEVDGRGVSGPASVT